MAAVSVSASNLNKLFCKCSLDEDGERSWWVESDQEVRFGRRNISGNQTTLSPWAYCNPRCPQTQDGFDDCDISKGTISVVDIRILPSEYLLGAVRSELFNEAFVKVDRVLLSAVLPAAFRMLEKTTNERNEMRKTLRQCSAKSPQGNINCVAILGDYPVPEA